MLPSLGQQYIMQPMMGSMGLQLQTYPHMAGYPAVPPSVPPAVVAHYASGVQGPRPSLPLQPPPMQPPPQQPPMLPQARVPQSQPPRHWPQPAKEAVSPIDVAAGVESLYRDELKPYGRILRKRLVEQAQATGRGSVEINVKELRATCEACPFLCVRDVEGADWAALLPGRPPAFVDVYSLLDTYPEELWQEAAKYFASLDHTNMVLPGGRYACAQVLVQRRLPFLIGRSLGQVCHVVQLAISQRKLLGYLNGTVVPYSRSQSMVKEQSAECQRPCSGAARHKSPVASWDLMRQCLQQLIDNMGPGEHSLPLSNIKRLFRAQFHIELSETALGYAKLSECLQDPRLHDLCEVKLKGHGYGIVPIGKKVHRSRISLSDSLGVEPNYPPSETADMGASQKQEGSARRTDLLLSPDASPKPLTQLSVTTASPSSSTKASAHRSTPCRATPTRISFGPTPSPGSARPLTASYGSRRALSMATLAASPVQPLSSLGEASPAPSPKAQESRPLPRLLGRSRPPCLSSGSIKEVRTQVASPKGAKLARALASGSPAGASWIPPVGVSSGLNSSTESLVLQTPQKRTPESKPWGFTPMTPRTFGFSVHNTFLHAALPLPTPLRVGSRFRARSLDAC